MTRWAMRNVTGQYAGEVWQCSVPETEADYEKFRQELDDPDAFEVVQIDHNDQVIER